MIHKNEVVQKDNNDNLVKDKAKTQWQNTLDKHSELYLMKRLELLMYSSRTFNVVTEQEWTNPQKTERVFNIVVSDNKTDKILEIRSILDSNDLEWEFEQIKTKYILLI